MKTRREIIEDTIKDMVCDLMYYDRKEDDSLPCGAIEEAIAQGEIAVEEIINLFATEIRKDKSA